MDKKPLVTVFTILYNSAAYTIPALEMLELQNYAELEHIVIDDASTDDSAEVIQDWLVKNSPKSRFFRNKENLGINRNLNRVLQLARGQYLMGVSDDFLYPDLIQTLLPHFRQDVAVVFGDCRVVTAEREVILRSYFEWVGTPEPEDADEFFKSMLWKNVIPAQPVLISVEAVKRVGGWDEELLFEDWDMWLRLLKDFKVVKVDKIVADYVKRRGAMTAVAHYAEFDLTSAKLLVKHLGISRLHDSIIRRRIQRLALNQLRDPKVASAVLSIYLTRKPSVILRVLDVSIRIRTVRNILRVLAGLAARRRL